MTIGKKVKKALKEEFVLSKPFAELTHGRVLRILREKNGLSQKELSNMTGLAQSTLSSLENDRLGLGIERAKILAVALKVHPAVLAFPDWDSSIVAA